VHDSRSERSTYSQAFVPFFHEAHNPARLARVREEIAADPVQRNPVIVAPYGDRYLLLDSAHRARVLGEHGCRFALTQPVELPERAGS
jgi:L-serine kinase (ATP) / ParB family transcriptional regulator, heme-responsive regulator